jgi:hypothetical protein
VALSLKQIQAGAVEHWFDRQTARFRHRLSDDDSAGGAPYLQQLLSKLGIRTKFDHLFNALLITTAARSTRAMSIL